MLFGRSAARKRTDRASTRCSTRTNNIQGSSVRRSWRPDLRKRHRAALQSAQNPQERFGGVGGITGGRNGRGACCSMSGPAESGDGPAAVARADVDGFDRRRARAWCGGGAVRASWPKSGAAAHGRSTRTAPSGWNCRAGRDGTSEVAHRGTVSWNCSPATAAGRHPSLSWRRCLPVSRRSTPVRSGGGAASRTGGGAAG